MNHFFIGQPDKQIFLSRILARKQPTSRATLLFYPFGQEYMRAHKAFRQLANLLSRKGIDVYRFDYPGSGDSYGELSEFSFNDYSNAAQKVLEEVHLRKDYQQIDLIGLRFGALVAASVASNENKIRNIVLWDPYANGAAFVSDMKQQTDGHFDENTTWNVHGYELGTTLRNSLKDIQIEQLLIESTCNKHLLLSAANEQSRNLAHNLKPLSSNTVIGPANDWNFVDMAGSILMPSTLIKGIVNTISNN